MQLKIIIVIVQLSPQGRQFSSGGGGGGGGGSMCCYVACMINTLQ